MSHPTTGTRPFFYNRPLFGPKRRFACNFVGDIPVHRRSRPYSADACGRKVVAIKQSITRSISAGRTSRTDNIPTLQTTYWAAILRHLDTTSVGEVVLISRHGNCQCVLPFCDFLCNRQMYGAAAQWLWRWTCDQQQVAVTGVARWWSGWPKPTPISSKIIR